MLHLIYCKKISQNIEESKIMDKNRHAHSTRNSRRINRNQHTGKKLAILSLFTSMFLLIGGGLYVTHAIQHDTKETAEEDENNDYQQKAAALVEKIRQAQKEEPIESTEFLETTNDIQTLLYNPAQTKSIPQFSTLKSELTAMIDTIKKDRANHAPRKIVGQLKMTKITEQLNRYQPFITTYTWEKNKQDWSKQTNTGKTSVVVNQKNNQRLTLTDLFTSEANLLAVQQIVQQKLLDDSLDGNAVIDGVLTMPKFSIQDTAFTYYPDKISLNLPDNPTGKKEVTLPYNEITGYINSEFVDPRSLQETPPVALDPNKKYISLTFDDGPNPKTTPKLLDILKDKGVNATFFMLGQNVVKNEAIVKRTAEEGHEVASHSYSHPQLTELSPERINEEVQNTDKAIYRAIGKLPTDFRPPYGAVTPEVAAIINKPIIQWSVDSQDWQSHNVDKIIQRVHDTEYNDAIILMHDIHPETVEAVPIVIDRLREEGYEIIPSKQLLGNKTKPMHMYYGSTDERPIQ